ncbi:MAG: FxLYD domain-containing protein [Gemmatimonadales bacterium]
MPIATLIRPRRLIILALLGFVVLATVTWLVLRRSGGEQVQVEADWFTDESGARFIAGTVANRTRESYAHLRVEITLLDSAGTGIGNTFATATSLEAGETWEFRAPVSLPAATSFRVEGVSTAGGPPDP